MFCSFVTTAVPGGSPENFTATGVSSTSVELRWDRPAKHLRHGDIVLYEALYHRADRPLDDFAVNTTDTAVIVDGLDVGEDYIFRLRAYTAKGSGPWTSRLPFKTFANRQYINQSINQSFYLLRINLNGNNAYM